MTKITKFCNHAQYKVQTRGLNTSSCVLRCTSWNSYCSLFYNTFSRVNMAGAPVWKLHRVSNKTLVARFLLYIETIHYQHFFVSFQSHVRSPQPWRQGLCVSHRPPPCSRATSLCVLARAHPRCDIESLLSSAPTWADVEHHRHRPPFCFWCNTAPFPKKSSITMKYWLLMKIAYPCCHLCEGKRKDQACEAVLQTPWISASLFLCLNYLEARAVMKWPN